MYVYVHHVYTSFSSMSFCIAQLYNVEECCSFITECSQHKHLTVLPYFYGDNFLREMDKEILLNNPNCDEYELFDSLLKKHFFLSKPVFSCEYNEDQWTARLFKCLTHNKIDCEYTAHLRGIHTEDAWDIKGVLDILGGTRFNHKQSKGRTKRRVICNIIN